MTRAILDIACYNNYRMNMVAKERKNNKQKSNFDSLHEETLFSLIRTSSVLLDGLATTLKPYGVSLPQYSALCILRDEGSGGLSCRVVGQRMTHRVPDVTRLLDRMEKRGLIERQRNEQDRRVVKVFITQYGIELIAQLDEPMRESARRQLGAISDKKLAKLTATLERIRTPLDD
jgi:DNA-binding MarR family transcriptional regulator